MSDQSETQLQSAFGAKLEVGVQLRSEMSPLELAKHRARTKLLVKTCAKCGLSQTCKSPVPMELPSGIGAKVLVIGEAPGKREDELTRPFVGPAGKLMKAMLNEAGFDVSEVGFCNTVSCWPMREPPTPTVKEMTACRGNLRDQVVSSGSTYILLAGGVATSAWRGDLKVSDVHGQVFLWGRIWVVMPVFHPAAILRDVGKKQTTIEDLKRFNQVVESGRVIEALGTVCVKCTEQVAHYDPDGVPYCDRHWLRYGGQWKREMGRWNNDRVKKIKRVLVKGKASVGKGVPLIEGQGTIV
jgi:uracil-DNA glycosylase